MYRRVPAGLPRMVDHPKGRPGHLFLALLSPSWHRVNIHLALSSGCCMLYILCDMRVAILRSNSFRRFLRYHCEYVIAHICLSRVSCIVRRRTVLVYAHKDYRLRARDKRKLGAVN